MYRAQWQPDQYISLRPSTVRVLTLVALILYPAGALLAALTQADTPLANLGGLVALIAVMCGIAVIASRTHRLLTAKPTELDEFELSLRYRATSTAYAILTALVVGGVLYLNLASEHGWWAPSSKDQWRGVFWGAFLYAVLLPTAVLVWTARTDEIAADEDGE